MGTDQNRKTYRRHGATGGLFGVSYANLALLKKRIQIDQRLATELWATRNHDARVLANMIADPDAMSARELDRWIADVDNHMLSESMTSMLLRSANARAHIDRWIDSPQEWICATGWQVLGGLAGADHDFPAEYLLQRLAQIEATLRSSANRVRHAMVLALIGIGMRGPAFEEAAVAAACKIGPVHVDHGDTDCQTPDPIPYLRRIAAHRASRPSGVRAATASTAPRAPRKRPSTTKKTAANSASTISRSPKKRPPKAPSAPKDPPAVAKSAPEKAGSARKTAPTSHPGKKRST
jgi:3-methyladenine DNA glycosylase AlkD